MAPKVCKQHVMHTFSPIALYINWCHEAYQLIREVSFFVSGSDEYTSYSTVLRIAFFRLKNFGCLQQHPFKS